MSYKILVKKIELQSFSYKILVCGEVGWFFGAEVGCLSYKEVEYFFLGRGCLIKQNFSYKILVTKF